MASTSVDLHWSAPEGHSAFELEWREKVRKGTANSTFKEWERASARIKALCCRKKNLTPGTVFEFRVRSVAPVTSHWSMPINVKTLWQDVDGVDDEGVDPFREPDFHHHEYDHEQHEKPRQPSFDKHAKVTCR